MVDGRECGVCESLVAEFAAALSGVEASPKLSQELRDDAGLFLRIGTGEGADEAIDQFPFHISQSRLKYPKIAAAIARIIQHRIQTGHKFPFSR